MTMQDQSKVTLYFIQKINTIIESDRQSADKVAERREKRQRCCPFRLGQSDGSTYIIAVR